MNLYRHINRNKIIFDFINYFDRDMEQFYEKEVIGYGSKVFKTGSMNSKNLVIRHIKKVKELYKLLRVNKYTVIHIHASDSTSLEDAIVAKFVGVPRIIVHSHNTAISHDDKFYWIKEIFHYIMKNLWGYVATDYFACSELAAQWMYTKKLILSNKVKIVNNAIEFKKYLFNNNIREKLRKELNIGDKFVVGHIGRMSYQKNHEYLIEVFSEVKKQYDNSVLLLIGDGELKNKIKKKVAELKLQDSVIFYGVTNQVENLMQVMDVFVLPSVYEGLPLVGIESQASGLKLIVSDTISKQMSITENVRYLSLNDGIKTWADEILKYANGYERIDMNKYFESSVYDIKYISKEIESFYERGEYDA